MGQIKNDFENKNKIKSYVRTQKTTISKGLIWIKVENVKILNIEQIGTLKIYKVFYQLVDCDVNTGVEIGRKSEISKYIIVKGKVKIY